MQINLIAGTWKMKQGYDDPWQTFYDSGFQNPNLEDVTLQFQGYGNATVEPIPDTAPPPVLVTASLNDFNPRSVAPGTINEYQGVKFPSKAGGSDHFLAEFH